MAEPGLGDAPVARHLAPAQVAELLALDVDAVMSLVHEGRLSGARLGAPAVWRIEQASVEAYLDEQAEGARRIALWHESQIASFPEVWGARGPRA
jgi:excisionase family DNA binding protein